jgi:DNA-directed RNA polymerase I, II, and III subunit RPABC2
VWHSSTPQSFSYCLLTVYLISDEPIDEIEDDVFDQIEDQFYESAGEGDIDAVQDLGDKEGDDGNIVHIGEPEKKRKKEEAKSKKIPKDKRTTTPFMTKYEKARILGTRSLQIR